MRLKSNFCSKSLHFLKLFSLKKCNDLLQKKGMETVKSHQIMRCAQFDAILMEIYGFFCLKKCSGLLREAKKTRTSGLKTLLRKKKTN